MEDGLTDVPAKLLALLPGLVPGADLRLAIGRPGEGWSYAARSDTITLDPDDLQRDELEVLGLLQHEAAHAAITRYPWLVPEHLLREPGVGLLLNALEDVRIERWMARRLPGSGPAFAALNRRWVPADGGRIPTAPPYQQFALGALHEGLHGELPEGLDDAVRARLDETRAAREAVWAAQPPTEPLLRCTTYAGSRVERVFERQDRGAAVEPWEAEVRCVAAQAWATVYTSILPAFRTLVARTPRSEVLAFEAAHAESWVRGDHGVAPRRGAHVTGSDAVVRSDDWSSALRDVLPLVDELTRELDDLLKARRRPRWKTGRRTGQRPDLRRLMQRAARPEDLGVWARRTVPERTERTFAIALDVSGSMAGAGIHWGFRGVVLLAEVLERLQVPYGIWGFQDVLLPFKAVDAPLARKTLDGLLQEVHGRRPGGRNRPEHNWDGPVLHALVEALGDRPSPVLLMVSDGTPSGPAAGEDALRAAIRQVPDHVELIGIGLGPGAAHVEDLYPRFVSCGLEGFPAALGDCLRESLHA